MTTMKSLAVFVHDLALFGKTSVNQGSDVRTHRHLLPPTATYLQYLVIGLTPMAVRLSQSLANGLE